MDSLPKRLSHIRGKRSKTEFAKHLGVSKVYITRYENGEVKPSFDFLKILTEKENININWLLTGEGDIFFSRTTNQELLKENINLKDKIKKINTAIYDQVTKLKDINKHNHKKIKNENS